MSIMSIIISIGDKMAYCNQCGYEWKPKFDREPIACTRCKRYDYREGKKGDGNAATKSRSAKGVSKATVKGEALSSDYGVVGEHVSCRSCGSVSGVHAKGCKR